MEDEIVNESEPNEGDAEPVFEITKILNDILDQTHTVPEPLPSTSKKDGEVPVSDEREHCSGSISGQTNLQPQGDAANTDLTETDEKEGRAENTPPFATCTVKDMLNEILDCTVVRRASPPPSTSQWSESNMAGSSFFGNFDAPPDYFLDPRLIPRQLYNIRNDAEEGPSRMHSTVKEVLNEILDYTVFKKSLQSGSCRAIIVNDLSRPGTSQCLPDGYRVPDYMPQREYMGNREFQIYRSMAAGVINSSNAVHEETYMQMPVTKSLNRILPTYSTVLKLGPAKLKSVHSSPSFIPKLPPPSYAEVEGLWEDGPSLISSESIVFGPDPTYMVCPRCRTIVVTEVETERSNFTHLIALVMCLCLCWPCCLLPYCLRSCNYTYHTCPNCRHYFGMYRPF